MHHHTPQDGSSQDASHSQDRAPGARRFRRRPFEGRTAAATVWMLAAAPLLARAQPASADEGAVAYEPGVHQIVATAYCLDGTMANGETVHDGAAAMRGVPFGTPVTVLDGPNAGMALVVKDRVPRSGILDIWMNDCAAAREHGSRLVTIEVRAA